jgi:hypothetical protein
LSCLAQPLTIGANGVILITTKTGKRIQSQESVSILIQVFRKQQSRLALNARMHYCSMKVMQTEVIQFLLM